MTDADMFLDEMRKLTFRAAKAEAALEELKSAASKHLEAGDALVSLVRNTVDRWDGSTCGAYIIVQNLREAFKALKV